MHKPPERIHSLKGKEVAVLAGGETLRGRLADVQGDCLILTSQDFQAEVTVAVVRWPLVAAVVAKEEPAPEAPTVVTQGGASAVRCADCGETFGSWVSFGYHREHHHP
jgi:hypothetical protein